MTGRDRDELDKRPHLSYSRVNRYLHCPEQYRLYYIENLRPRFPSSSLAFGSVVHEALASMFRDGSDSVQSFIEGWTAVREADLDYGKKDSWEKLKNCGEKLLEKFVQEQVPRINGIQAVEQSFEVNISQLDLPFIGYIDLIANVGDADTVVDFKTSSASYAGHEATMSDQLTAYQLAVPSASHFGLCVLLKLKEPRIEWFCTHRDGSRLVEYLAKVKLVAREINAGQFYKRPGRWCSWCDYLPVCLDDKQKTKQTLVKIDR
jgi:putative RecB family exonuclease